MSDSVAIEHYDLSVPLDKAKLSFSAPRPIVKGNNQLTGVQVQVSYEGKPLVFKTRFLKLPFGVSKGYNGGGGGGGGDGDNNKPKIDLDLPVTPDNQPLRDALNAVEEALKDHIKTEASNIFGDTGLALKNKALADKLKEVAADTIKFYGIMRQNNDKYDPKLKLGLSPDFEAFNRKGLKKMAIDDIPKMCDMTAVFRIRGLYISGLMVTVQADALLACVSLTKTVDTKSIFAADAEPDEEGDGGDEDGDDKAKPPSAKKAKLADDGADDY
jgi:hypothetical protein